MWSLKPEIIVLYNKQVNFVGRLTSCGEDGIAVPCSESRCEPAAMDSSAMA